jgi:MoxR-like ATPase
MSVIIKQAQISEKEMVAEAEKALSDISRVREGVGRVIFGQESVVERTLVALLAGGHALLVGVPGLAKTKLVETLGVVLGMDARRIQFTPDLMPSDILGSEVMEQDELGKRSFRFIPGPIFAQLLMADEINRASPRTQSALLQSMQEYHVTVAGARHDLPSPFHVLATQNPLEQEGTYPLPEAQLDRFLMQIDILYPELEAERRILLETTGVEDARAQNVLTPDRLGPGPRASQALTLCARARALYDGRLAPSIDDIKALAEPVLQHRMALTFAARAEGMSVRDVVARLVKGI